MRPEHKIESRFSHTMKEPADERLDSWKEIAAFLNRGVRTVQRWESTEGLPVHRHHHAKLGSVYAVRSEVAGWWKSRGAPLDAAQTNDQSSAAHESTTPQKLCLLVLPFENLSSDRNEEYLADGFTEEMITQLARLSLIHI